MSILYLMAAEAEAELNQLSDWTGYLHIIDEKLAAAVDLIKKAYS